jgi:hypothetical protein
MARSWAAVAVELWGSQPNRPMATSTATATYSEFSRYCGQFAIDPIDESLYIKLIQVFPFLKVFTFACNVYCGDVDGFTIQLWRAIDDCGAVGYGLARTYCSYYGLEDQFIQVYGIAGDCEDPEDGSPIGIDAGELIAWVDSRA